MIPQAKINTNHPDFKIKDRDEWAALLLAHQHKIDAEARGEVWSCLCRCCLLAWDKGRLKS